MRILVTGSAGFIGFHLCRRLLTEGHEVAGVDGLTPYYDVELKRRRHAILQENPQFSAHVLMLEDMEGLSALARRFAPEVVVHLAAQAGVRYSLDQPRSYVDSNLVGGFNIMEVARQAQAGHFLVASTSSVYGGNTKTPFAETDATDHPLSLYAATKKAFEAMTHAYSHLWSLPTTNFRFFTVYGPWGRPDMALFRFAEAILEGRPIDLYNGGVLDRDFTYVGDLVEAVVRLMETPPQRGQRAGEFDTLSPVAPWRVVNIGGGSPVKLTEFVAEVENALGRKASVNLMPMQPGDMAQTYAACELLVALTGYRPDTPLASGVRAFCAWLLAYRAEAVLGPV